MHHLTGNAIVLLSGGLDSVTVLALANAEGFDAYALSFDYGQRHRVELEAAHRVSHACGAKRHITVRLDIAQFGGSALTDLDIDVPKNRDLQEMQAGIPTTYVPARNTIFLSHALAWAEVLPARDIFIGVNALDYSGYPDCRPEFIEAFETMASRATKLGASGDSIRIHAPLMRLNKAEIIRRGLELGVDYGKTISCYDPSPAGQACGHCDACLLRAKGFAEAGTSDPALLQTL